MARSHAKVLTEIWRNPEWVALSGNAQRVYLLLLSQPKLSLVGVLDYMPERWAALCADSTPYEVEHGIMELDDAGFVVLDQSTGELLIRTFMKHDLTPARLNVNLVKGLWGAWAMVASLYLRSVVASLIPDAVWDESRADIPADALQIRRSEPMERPVRTTRYDDPSERPDRTTFRPSPVTSHLSPSEAASNQSRERETLAKNAALLWANDDIDDRIEAGAQFTAPDAVARKRAAEDLWPEHGAALTALAETNPDVLDARELLDLHRSTRPKRTRPVDPAEATAAAALALMERNKKRSEGNGCRVCDGTGWIEASEGATPCECSGLRSVS